MTIGVTGPRGLIGTALVRHLTNRQAGPLRLLVRNPAAGLGETFPGADVVRGDLMSVKDCEVFADGLSVIFYLAHRNTPVTSDLDLPNDALVNLVPLLNLIQAVRSAGTKPHIVYFSSGGAIYGRRRAPVPFVETDACAPSSSYGIQKLAAEHYLRLGADRGLLTTTILRVGNAYGTLLPPERMQGLVGVALNNALQSRPVTVFGNPGNVRDYVHLDDICAIAERAMTPLAECSIFNVGTQKGYSVTEVLAVIERCTGARVTCEYPANRVVGEWLPDWCVLDIRRARELLQWTPTVDLADGIARMLPESRQSS